MVRLADLPPNEAQHMRDQPCEPFEAQPFARSKPVSQSRICIITTAGLHLRDQPGWRSGDADYRVISGDIEPNDLVMGHVSVNFDRTGFQQDVNVVFPIERLRELHKNGEVGSVASFHYSMMGATATPGALEAPVRVLAELLHSDNVDAVLLFPV